MRCILLRVFLNYLVEVLALALRPWKRGLRRGSIGWGLRSGGLLTLEVEARCGM